MLVLAYKCPKFVAKILPDIPIINFLLFKNNFSSVIKLSFKLRNFFDKIHYFYYIKNMKMLLSLIILFLSACTSVSITERKQLIILGDNVIYPQAFKAYDEFKKKNKLIDSGDDFNKIQEVTENIKRAIKIFYENHRRPDPTANFKWEVILVDNKEIKNAWCMPGGKMAVYTEF